MNQHGQRGFTLLELVLAIGLLGLLMPAITSMLRQTVIQTDRNTTRITALTPLENTGRWMGRDIPLAQAINLVDGAPAVTQLILYWTDWSDNSNYGQYSSTLAAYKRVRAKYTLAGGILTRTLATCANTVEADYTCVSGVVSGAGWTDNTKWVTCPWPTPTPTPRPTPTPTATPVSSAVLTLSPTPTFNTCTRKTESASPLPVVRDLTTFQVSRTGSAVTVVVASSPKGAAFPTESRTYRLYASLLGVGDPVQ